MKQLCFALCLFSTLQASFAQNLTGTWEGVDNDFKIVLLHIGDSCYGYTYDTGLGFCKANFIGQYTDSDNKLKGINTSFIERSFTHGLSRYRLVYSKRTDGEYLKGTAGTKSAVASIMSLGLGIPLRYKKVSGSFDTTALIASRLSGRLAQPDNTALIPQVPAQQYKSDSARVQGLVKVKEARKSQVFNTIYTESDSLELTLYDNGEIDNDTVTVFHNGKVVVDHLGLTVRPAVFKVSIDDADSLQIIELMANNLGSIPPNTAYMVIADGKKRYELRLSADFSINARINIIRLKGDQ